jgi:DNA polymerase V
MISRGIFMAFPSPADDYREPRLALDDLIVHPAATYFVHNTGLAMEPTFHAGDVLIVDRAIVALDGRAVVVIYREQFLVRRIVITDDQITLKADNPAFVDIVASPEEIQVWGVITYAIHKDSAPTYKIKHKAK